MNRFLAALCLLLPLVAAGPAAADDDRPARDQIVLRLVEEGWVETQSARVMLQLKTLLTDDGRQEAPLDPEASFRQVAEGDWRITRFERQQTDTGFEQWLIVGEARLPQQALTGIYDRVEQASSKGKTFSILGIDFSPSLAEREATAAKLRAAIYERAAAEAKQVAKMLPDIGFAVHRVDFEDSGLPRPTMMRSQAMEGQAMRAQSAPEGETAPGPAVAERMVMAATVVIASRRLDNDD